MPGLPTEVNGAPMAKSRTRAPRHTTDDDTMRPHYDFSKGDRGVTAARYHEGTNVVLVDHVVTLDPDVASAFPSSAAVNKALRSLMRGTRPRKPRSRRNAQKR